MPSLQCLAGEREPDPAGGSQTKPLPAHDFGGRTDHLRSPAACCSWGQDHTGCCTNVCSETDDQTEKKQFEFYSDLFSSQHLGG